MAIGQAQQLADEANLDLVNISPKAEPPVCRIMDYGKYRFEQEKKLKEAKKNQKTTQLKEMRLSATIDTHDLEVKAKNVQKFLAGGDKVKVSIRFRGRQMAHTAGGLEVMNQFLALLDDGVMRMRIVRLTFPSWHRRYAEINIGGQTNAEDQDP